MQVIADILERHERGQSDRAIAHDPGLGAPPYAKLA